LESTECGRGIEVDGALEMAEQMGQVAGGVTAGPVGADGE
jgi:hypothetical protein